MKRTWIALLIGLLLNVMLMACSSPSIPSNPTSMGNSSPQIEGQVRRVVALSPLTTDLVYQLDKTRLVGVPGSKLIQKDERFKSLPIVSAEQAPPNLEKIVALKPDLVVGTAGFHDQILGKLQQLKVQTLTTKVTTWQALEELTTNLAQALKVDPQPLRDRYQQFFADIPSSKQTALVLVSRQPILSPNKTSWAGDLLDRFKINNLTAELQGNNPMRGYVTLSPEKILKEDPETVLLVDNGDNILEQFKAESYWKQLQAVKRDRVYVFDYYGLVNPGSIGSIEKACTQLRKITSLQ
jgi:iron complex transport system substrate-binding protein